MITDLEERPGPTPVQRHAARVVGVLYLLTMATGVFSEMFVRERLIVRGDATATASNIAAAEFLYRLGLYADVVTMAGVVVLAWALWVVLKPVGPHLAALAVLLRAVEVSVAASGLTAGLGVLRWLGSASYLSAFEPAQRHVLARVLLGAQAAATQIAFVLLGLGSTVFAFLWLRSRYVPRPLAALGVVGSLLLAAVTILSLVFPGLDALGMSCMIPLGVFEVGLGGWLLARGLASPRSPE